MVPLLLFILLGLTVLVLFEWRARRQTEQQRREEENAIKERQRQNTEGECCGQHLVCERELPPKETPDYYDDEELDALAGIPASDYTPQQQQLVRDVFLTLHETDVIGWVRSLQMRNIQLPPDIREEALLIVREQRALSRHHS